jgi:O-antigen/teichoic acid export membrane protein
MKSLVDRANRARAYVFAEGLGPFLVRSVAGGGAVQLVGMALSFLVGVQLARGLGPQVFGQYGIAMAAVGILSIPGQFGLPQLVTREVAAALASKDSGVIRGIISWAGRFSWAVSAAIAVLTAICAGGYLLSGHREVAAALLFGSLLILLQTQTRVIGGALQGLHRIVLGQVPDTIVRPLVNSLVLLLLFALVPRASAADAMGTAALAAAFAFVAARLLLASNLPKGERRADVGDARKWIGSAVPLALTYGIRAIEGHVGVLFLGFLATETDAGYFRLALSIAVLVSLPIALVNNAVVPVFARLFAAGDMRKLQRLVTHAGRTQFVGVLLVSLPFFIGAKRLISIFFGVRYAPAANVLLLVAVAQLISTAFGPNGNLLNMTGHERRVSSIMLISLVTNAVTTGALIPLLGLVGAGLSWVIATFTWNVLAWHAARQQLGINTFVLAGVGSAGNWFRRPELADRQTAQDRDSD